MMHDIISDILVANTIPPEKKREVIYAQLDELQDTTSNVMSWDEWRNMGEMMGGVAIMGGPATALLAGVHAPVTPSPKAAGMEHSAMRHERGAMRHEPDEAAQRDSAAGHDMGAIGDTVRNQEPGMAHGEQHEVPAMRHPGMDSIPAADSAHMRRMLDLHMRMMADTAIRRRVMADTAMHRLMMDMMSEMPAQHREHMRRMMGHDTKKQARPQAPAPRCGRPEAKDSAAHHE
jgi:hypothetical protein